jgi:hypothetical protein
MNLDRRHAVLALATLPLVAAGCAGTKVPLPTDAAAVFTKAEQIIATFSVLVDAAEGWGTPAGIVAGARALIERARGYVAAAKADLGTGLWRTLADTVLGILNNIVFEPAAPAPAAAPGAPVAPAPSLTMTLRHTA